MLATAHAPTASAAASGLDQHSLKLARPYALEHRLDVDATPTSPEAAHVTFEYPFGRRLRCVRREWVERAEKGASKGMCRFVTQTTSKAFNAAYTDALEAGHTAELERLRSRLFVDRHPRDWNAPKASTYQDLIVLCEGELDDGRACVRQVAFAAHRGPEAFDAARALLPRSLPADIWDRLVSLERASRAMNPRGWAEHEEQHGGACVDAAVLFRPDYEAMSTDFRAADGERPSVLRLGRNGGTELVPARLVG